MAAIFGTLLYHNRKKLQIQCPGRQKGEKKRRGGSNETRKRRNDRVLFDKQAII